MKIKDLLEAISKKKPVAKWVVRSTNQTPKYLIGKAFVANSEEEAKKWNEENKFNGEITPEDKNGIKIPKGSILKPGSFKVKKEIPEGADWGAIIPGGEFSWAIVDMKTKDIYAFNFVSKKEAEDWAKK